ncbi:MAG: CBS domain-containing protein [Acidobacteria bacterium]|nr:CBS domain-containing protein [Acidobacteriota bacterium]
MKTMGSILAGREIYFVLQDQTAFEAAQLMAAKQVGAVPVLEGERVAGIFSERDLMNRVVAQDLDPKKVKVGDVMTRDLVAVEAHESYEIGLKRMKQINCRHLPVVSEGKLVGVISLRDLLLVDLVEKDEELQLMQSYIYYIPPKLK